MTSRLVMTKKDPRRADFVLVDDHNAAASASSASGAPSGTVYSSDTTHYTRPYNGIRATTTVTRRDSTGDRLQVGVIDWPVQHHEPTQLVVGTRRVHMSRPGIFVSSERFFAADGGVYEWQIMDTRPQLVPIRGYHRPPTSYVATFVQSQSGFCLRRKHTSSLFVPPEGFHILDDIIVTFIYFESKWRDKEGAKRNVSLTGDMM